MVERKILTFPGKRRLEVARYVEEQGGAECFRLMRYRGKILVFFENEDEEIEEIQEKPGFQRSLIAHLKSEGVPIGSYWKMAREILGLIWYRPKLLWRFMRNQDPPETEEEWFGK
jgi:hypothetical protein